MHQTESIRSALHDQGGTASSEALSPFVRSRFGVAARPQFVPVVEAMLREPEMVVSVREILGTRNHEEEL
jgi:hypothetical protein